MALWQSRFQVAAQAVQPVLDELAEHCLSVTAYRGGDGAVAVAHWQIEALHDGEPDRAALAQSLAPLAAAAVAAEDIAVAPLPDADWLSLVAAQAPPQQIGRFWIHGRHVAQPPPAGSEPILLDAGLAFGSGEHPSTQGCLRALDALAKRRRFARVLDMGCGSGVLAIAAARCWPARVVAADCDPAAVRVAAENAAANGVAERLTAVHSDGYRAPAITRHGPYDLICANILADPLCDLARDLARHLAPGGVAVLAGLLATQAGRVAAAHAAYGCHLRQTLHDGAWATLVLASRAY